MSVSLSVLQLNVERAKHLATVVPFLKERMPEVVCLQELQEKDIPLFEGVLEAKCHFVPMALHPAEGDPSVMGAGIFSRFPVKNLKIEYYYGEGKNFSMFVPYTTEGFHRAFVYCDVEKEGTIFRIGTTHFTWSSDGEASELQRTDLKLLLPILEKAGEIVFMGDFNAPRGKEIFDEIAGVYKDNVPLKYIDSLDDDLHRRRDLKLMVDGLFSTPGYIVSDVEMICGLSDHCALVGNISKV